MIFLIKEKMGLLSMAKGLLFVVVMEAYLSF